MINRLTIGLLVATATSLSACAGRSPGATAGASAAPATSTAASAAASGESASAGGVVPQGTSATVAAAGGSSTAEAPKRKTSGPITEDELSHESVATLDAYAAIQRLRPSFLTSRGAVSLRGGGGGVMVSVDRSPPTSLSVLRSMRATEVREIRYLSASEAGQKFGTAAGNSAVLVVTRR